MEKVLHCKAMNFRKVADLHIKIHTDTQIITLVLNMLRIFLVFSTETDVRSNFCSAG